MDTTYYSVLLLTTDTTKSPSTSTIRTIRYPCCFPQPHFQGALSTGSGQVPLFLTSPKSDPCPHSQAGDRIDLLCGDRIPIPAPPSTAITLQSSVSGWGSLTSVLILNETYHSGQFPVRSWFGSDLKPLVIRNSCAPPVQTLSSHSSSLGAGRKTWSQTY
ncbi:hypothetical protein BO85DRAFT_295816 [Aspergillus piperis CBS 112811]|uniref:Uncharacterized protein n=1 Tax=Aspergillus piperis CBS 112811 TaxID=1448313 RepID=A0A8G1VPW0_9EURO|nr:hypothetical protein BO85DRAFT_295816 [Aspergillus piperis CBS 112811]RAH58118.1 hypothetical protein BO85DRAFT_295816 [Aspergillus piperis CBS 112811]